MLADKYEIIDRLNVSTGEADIYICLYQGKQYVAKVYRRATAIKPTILEALKSVRSPFIARTFEVGTYEGKPFEILPYYVSGSMQGQTCSFDELKTTIIPDINEALKILHEHSIVHKDVKPSNIMRWNDKKGVALIDFGISSVMENGNTMIVTRTGMTPEYSAPETFRGLFLDESDYYSFGITLYELFCGYTPYRNMTADQIAQYTAVQKIPFPATMPIALQELITGLTYVDITHRNEMNNPNKRWTYQEVLNWCMGKKQPLPGAATTATVTMPAYTFMGQRYSDTYSLVGALAGNWNNGKRQLFRGLMSGFFKGFNPELLIDGPYIKTRNTDVPLRGSDNQKVHILKKEYEQLYQDYMINNPNRIQNFTLKDGVVSVGIHKPDFSESFDSLMREKVRRNDNG